MEKVSCILITKEKEYPSLVLERINTGFFDEVIITTESPSVYQRYIAARHARNRIIYVQDDDVMVNYQVLFKKYDGRITNTMTEPFQKFYDPLGCTLVGWGCYFPKEMLDVFDKYIGVYGMDDHLLREADRIFTYLNKPFNTVIMSHEDLKQTPDRMSFESSHFPSMYGALYKVKKIIV